MRVLLTTDTVGGVWTYTRELTEGLLNFGHTVALVSFGRLPDLPQQHYVAHLARKFGHRFFYRASDMPLEWMPDNHLAYEQGAELLNRVAETFEPTILHTSQFCFGRSTLSIPTVTVAHSDVLSWADSCTPAGLPRSPWLTKYQHLVQQGLDASDAVVAPTFWMLNALARHFSLPAYRRVIANGRTLALPQPPPAREPQAVSAGRLWDPAKNIGLLQQIRSCPVLLAGAGTSADASTAVDDRSDANSTTKFVGNLPEPDLLYLFRCSRIYIAASLYEPFGLAPLEAALCGCVVVANDIPSLREVWGNAALYFATTADLEQHLTALTHKDHLFLTHQKLCSARAHTLTAEAMTAHYLSLYSELCHPSEAANASGSAALSHAI